MTAVEPAGESLAFERGGYHLMLIGPAKLRAGDEVEITLELGDGSKGVLRRRAAQAVARLPSGFFT